MLPRQKLVCAVLACVFSASATLAASAQLTEQAMNAQLKDKVYILRGFYADSTLDFDSGGQPKKKYQTTSPFSLHQRPADSKGKLDELAASPQGPEGWIFFRTANRPVRAAGQSVEAIRDRRAAGRHNRSGPGQRSDPST